MEYKNFFALLGGLALFLYGMHQMSEGLNAAAGEKMKQILERLTKNRFLGVGVGAAVTAVIQSSSATTVMVVGFVNSGMMTLRQAVWIIMGANIGTTITGQLIALDAGAVAPLLAFLGVVLILFAGRTGVRAVLSFFLTVLAIWKLLVPLYLKGYNPIWTGLVFTLLLSVLIIALVYGFDRRCVSAVSGTFLGILVTCLLGSLFTDLFQIHGAVMSSSESLLYAGYQDLNLTRIFMASIFIGASGALMDLSVDITSAVHEVVEKRPDIGWKEAVRSGMNVGRSAMGTMTTTLLLAYSGGYIALLMVFMAQGTPLVNILNYKHVAAEMVHTVIGSFGLVTVAPFTALCAGVLLSQKKKDLEEGKKD